MLYILFAIVKIFVIKKALSHRSRIETTALGRNLSESQNMMVQFFQDWVAPVVIDGIFNCVPIQGVQSRHSQCLVCLCYSEWCLVCHHEGYWSPSEYVWAVDVPPLRGGKDNQADGMTRDADSLVSNTFYCLKDNKLVSWRMWLTKDILTHPHIISGSRVRILRRLIFHQ